MMFVEDFKCFYRTPDMECSMWSLLEEAVELGQTLASLFLPSSLTLQSPQVCFGVHEWEAPRTFHFKSWCITYTLAAQTQWTLGC